MADVLAPGVYGAPRRIDDLSTNELVEARPSIRHDGLELFFFGNDWDARGQYDIFTATRADLDSPWSPRVKLGASVNGPATNDQQPFIAADRETLFFVTNRAPGYGGADVWVTVRTKVAAPED